MTIQIFNSLSRKKEAFEPRVAGQVSMYVCGVTVYDHCHIGHARAYVTFDIIRRVLTQAGYTVNYIQNFTDVDDKIIKKAQDSQQNIQAITEQFIASYFQDMDALNIQRANAYPKATTHIKEICQMIEILIKNEAAYVSDGHVYFAVNAFKAYGALSHKVLDDLVSGYRVDVNENKRNPLDFVLWKPAKPNEPAWDSPWGPGRPGWHIECSAMAKATLGPSIDIHGGGEDLIFPHHENEIAQSEMANQCQFSKYWIHNGFVNIDNQKMSKSLKNFVAIHQLLKDFPGESIRFFLLKSHYRTPLTYSPDRLKEAHVALEKLKRTLKIEDKNTDTLELKDFERRFEAALQDDFNTAEAIGILFELSHYCNTHQNGLSLLKKLGNQIGIFESKTENAITPAHILEMIEERNQARKDKNFARSDEIRNALRDQGVILEDTTQETRWTYAT